MKWQPIETAPTDGSMFYGFDPKHGRLKMRRWQSGSALHQETWAIDPAGIIDPPEPTMWHPLSDFLPELPTGAPRMTLTNDAPVTVEQCDQTLVAEILEAAETMQIAGNDIAAIRNGFWNEDESDLGFLLQIAARHRLAALASAPAGGGVEDEYIYDELWQAIADATRIKGGAIAISVKAFRDSIRDTGSAAALARPRGAVGEPLPADVAELVNRIGRAEWGATDALDADEHGKHVADSVRITAANFDQTEPQRMQGLYVEGTETVICHVGTSPNSPAVARALAGAWNRLCDLAALQSPPAKVEG